MDAKAWQPEENLQALLTQCVKGVAATLPTNLHSAVGSSANAADEAVVLSTANSVVGAPADAASQYSNESAASAVLQCRQLFAALRHNLMQIMVTMDEKNHVINNANEELSRHLRRLDDVYRSLADEISEEARLGSLKHWAYTETNPTKKNAPANRREAANNLALLHDTEVASRSEVRREAVAAKKNRLDRLAQIDAGFEEIRTVTKKTVADARRRVADSADVAGLGISGTGASTSKRKKPDKTPASMAMDKSMSVTGSRAMSREPSQQENPKKRKAPTAASTIARKKYGPPPSDSIFADICASRLNANQDSPKLASSPLASNFGKDAYKRSPALGAARPASSRVRQNSMQRPPSSASQRNANGVASAQDLNNVAAGNGKTTNLKETAVTKGDRSNDTETASGPKGDAGSRGGLLLERRASKQGNTRAETLENDTKAAASPRLSIATTGNMRGRASKTSTPVIGSFAESELTGAYGNGNGKSKRLVRPKAKDHGLHDSLSPKGLPLKRSHKKGAGLLAQQQVMAQRKQEIENTTPEEDDEEGAGEDEERYCYCEGPSYGEMVACDNDDCPRQWFHIECLGLKTVPKSASWYCSECRDIGKGTKGKVNGNGNGGGR